MEINSNLPAQCRLSPIIYAPKIITIFLMMLMLAACTSIPSAPIQVQVVAAEQLNLDSTRESLPVRLKIYQLNDVTLLNEATFRQLWKSDVAVLGSTLLDKKELTINPNEKLSFKLSRHPQADYLAVVGIFRRHEDNGWKTVKPLPGQINTLLKQVLITVKGHVVEIS